MPFAIAAALALVLTPVARRAGIVAGLVDRPVDQLKIHRGPVSVLGGGAVAVAVVVAIAVTGDWFSLPIVAAIGVALAVGLVDDVRYLPAGVRLLVLAAAGALVTQHAGFELAGPLGAAGVVIVVLLCTNAANMLDGQDGLAAGVGAIAALGLAGLLALNDAWGPAGASLALAGALTGFLAFNRPVASIFLGNGGAYAMGTLLAALAAEVVALDGWRGLLAAGVCLGALPFEFIFTVARRLSSGDRMVAGDRWHSYDLLVYRLGDRARVTFVAWALAAGAAGLALAIGSWPLPLGVAATTLAGAGAAAWAVRLWTATRPARTT
jgi:UDP-GlcNAc:undecaprenyl-phosphate GlcNAc-1-phosphate transferase